jgi:hypothetical protein
MVACLLPYIHAEDPIEPVLVSPSIVSYSTIDLDNFKELRGCLSIYRSRSASTDRDMKISNGRMNPVGLMDYDLG